MIPVVEHLLSRVTDARDGLHGVDGVLACGRMGHMGQVGAWGTLRAVLLSCVHAHPHPKVKLGMLPCTHAFKLLGLR